MRCLGTVVAALAAAGRASAFVPPGGAAAAAPASSGSSSSSSNSNSSSFTGSRCNALRGGSGSGRGLRTNSSGTTMSMRITAEDVLKNPQWPPKWPFSPADFKRMDETSDSEFYDQARLVLHIDDAAVGALTKYYAKSLPEGADVLDICSSWVSHFPHDWRHGKRVGLGMNKYELSENKQLDEYVVRDLNVEPALPFPDDSFDVVTCVVSIDYLVHPDKIFPEMARVLRPGGKFIISMSNRCFPTKAFNLWLQTNDLEHIFIVGAFAHYCRAFQPAQAHDISPNPGRSDPMYIVEAVVKK